MCFYILGGKQCYEFIRLNLPDALPSYKTVDNLVKVSSATFNEGEFKFQLLD